MKEATGPTRLRLLYYSEALLLVDIGVKTIRFKHWNQQENEESRLIVLELIDEVKEDSTWKMATYHNRIARLYNTKVKQRSF